MSQKVTVDGTEVPTEFDRNDLTTWNGSVPSHFEVDEFFRYDGVLHGGAFLADGNYVEVSEDGDGWKAEHISNPVPLDVEVLWERPGREKREIEELLRAGLSTAEAVDYLAVERWGHTQTGWADVRGLDGHQSVGRNVRAAREKLQE